MPTVEPGESRSHYMARCVPYVMNSEGLTNDQAVGKCEGMYDEHAGKGFVEEARSGVKMPEPLARRIEELSKDLPGDFTFRRLSQNTVPQLGELEDGSKTDISMITTDAIDRDNEVVLPKGIALDDFRKSPTVFYAHDYQNPVGKCRWIKPHANGLSAMTSYCKKPRDWQGGWLPDAIHSMMQEGVGTGKSIGFIPLSMRKPTKDEIARRPELKNVSHVIDRSVMLEYSIAPLPANQEALALAVSKCVKDQELANFIAKSYGLELKDAADGDDDNDAGDMRCPQGHGPSGVTKMPDGNYHCQKCMRMYPPGQMRPADDDGDNKSFWGADVKTPHDVHLNHAGVAHAMSAANSGDISHGPFDGGSTPRNAANGNKFLAVNTHYGPQEKGHWMFPVFTGDKVSAKGVGTAGHYAEHLYPEIHAATVRIAAAIKSHGDAQDRKAVIEAALRTPHFSDSEVKAEEARQLAAMQSKVEEEVARRMDLAWALLTGKI